MVGLMFAGARWVTLEGVPKAFGYALVLAIYLCWSARITFKPGTMIARMAGVLLIASFLEFMAYVLVERG
jgi:hypothetical protein